MNADDKIRQLKQMAEADPDDALTLFMLGSEQIRAADYDDAVVSLRRSLEIKPSQAAAARLLADAYRRCAVFVG